MQLIPPFSLKEKGENWFEDLKVPFSILREGDLGDELRWMCEQNLVALLNLTLLDYSLVIYRFLSG